MKLIRDYLCSSCNSVTEKYIETTITEIDCQCGSKAHRVIGMPSVRLEGITGSFPGAHDKWARVREDRARKNARNSE
jgi:DNA-directed RNA polymerase subunit RPC12/RpoP